MKQNIAQASKHPSVAPLRKRRDDNTLYFRRSEVEAALPVLVGLSEQALADRARILDPEDPNYLSSECVLHLLRRKDLSNDALRELFVAIRQRILRAVPVVPQRVAGVKRPTERSSDQEIQESVLQKFLEMLCNERKGNYEERLDFFECEFNCAVASLRATAQKRVRRDESRFESTDFTDNAGEGASEIESRLLEMRNTLDESMDFHYRSKLHAAISSLPADQRQVVELSFQGVPIDSQKEGVLTIVSLVGCCAKTVYNLRKRAFETLRDALKEEEKV